MISVEEAYKKVLEYTGLHYITGITDIGYGYVIGYTDTKNQVLATCPLLVYKDSGKIDCYVVPEHIEEIDRGKELEVPKEIWFGGLKETE